MLIPDTLIGWESSLDPHCMDICEVDSSALLHYNTKNGSYGISVGPDLLRLVHLLGFGIS